MKRPKIERKTARKLVRSVLAEVANTHGLTEADLLVRDKHKPAVTARHEAWAICYRLGLTHEAIASVGGWDNSTVRGGVRRAACR